MQRSDIIGKIIGLLVFFAGIGLLCFVFYLSYNYYTDANFINFSQKNTANSTAVSQLGSSAIVMFVKIGLLFVMAVVGSLIASRGIHLYFNSNIKKESCPE